MITLVLLVVLVLPWVAVSMIRIASPPPMSAQERDILFGRYDKERGLAWAIDKNDSRLTSAAMVAVYNRASRIKDDEVVAVLTACSPPTELTYLEVGICARLFGKNPDMMVRGLLHLIEERVIDLTDKEVCDFVQYLLRDVPLDFHDSEEYQAVQKYLEECD